VVSKDLRKLNKKALSRKTKYDRIGYVAVRLSTPLAVPALLFVLAKPNVITVAALVSGSRVARMIRKRRTDRR
jgi:hypothetical protein